MRLTSEFFVAQLTRRLFADGSFAAVERRGAEQAGAIFILSRGRDGSLALYGPASQTHSVEGKDRQFMREAVEGDALARRFEREARFDPDFWVVEIETDNPERYLDIVEV